MAYRKEALNKNSSVFSPLLTSRFFALSKKSIFSKAGPVSIEELKNRTLILPENVNFPKEVQPLFVHLSKNVPMSNIHYCDSVETARMFAKSGLGTTVLPEFDFTADNDMLAMPLDFDFTLEYGAGYLKSNPEKKLIEKILKISEECIHQLRLG